MLYKIYTFIHLLGKTHLYFEHLQDVIVDIEKHLNNRPLTYVESDKGRTQTLLPTVLMWGQNANEVEDNEIDEDKVTKLHRRLKNVREHTWLFHLLHIIHGSIGRKSISTD